MATSNPLDDHAPDDYQATPTAWIQSGSTHVAGTHAEEQSTAYLVAGHTNDDEATVTLRYATAYGDHHAIEIQYDADRLTRLVDAGVPPLTYIIDHDHHADAQAAEPRTEGDRRLLRELYPGLGLREKASSGVEA